MGTCSDWIGGKVEGELRAVPTYHAEEFVSQSRGGGDIDLAVESIEHPEQFPLVSQAQPNKRLQPSTGGAIMSRRG